MASTECRWPTTSPSRRLVEFVRPCNLCPHMKKITLDKDPALAGGP
ncbi:MAG: hypothetical protein R2749_06385 [Acidimicrobiales bacterium]